MRLGHKRRPFVDVGYLPHYVETLTALFDEVLHYLWVETEECKLLNDLVNQFLELWRVNQERRGELTKSVGSPGGSLSHSP